MTSTASQSSSSGCDGASLWVPRSSLVLTRPVPKYACQTRLTSARAVVGDFGSTSQRAKSRRLGAADKNPSPGPSPKRGGEEESSPPPRFGEGVGGRGFFLPP